MRIKKYLPSLLVSSLFILFAGVSSVSAQDPSSYYDWSTTLEAQQKDVLGIAYAQESTPSAQRSNTGPTTIPNLIDIFLEVI